MKKIVVLDAYPFTNNDFNFLKEFGECHIYDKSTEADVAKRIEDADIVVVNKAKITASELAGAKNLKLITVLATGYNIVDIIAAKAQGIAVANIPGYSTDAVAQHTFSLLLELNNHVAYYSNLVSSDGWAKSQRWCIIEPVINELSGKTLGLIGFGAIGQKVAAIARAFGMKVLVHSRTVKPTDGIEFVSLDKLFSDSDAISLHCPLTPDTLNIINDKNLRLMKPTSFLINTGRGPLVDENALYTALKNNVIAGAALDVLTVEPPAVGHPLTGLRNCIITPHIAWASVEACGRIFQVTDKNISAFLNDSPQNIVN